jgi:hypothetical protein
VMIEIHAELQDCQGLCMMQGMWLLWYLFCMMWK